MLNKKPIFIMAFARGGSSILLNMLRSHPDVCSPRGEVNEVFKGKSREGLVTRLTKRARYLPIYLESRRDIFSMEDWTDRPMLSERSVRRIDRIFLVEKERATDPTQNLYKSPGVEYSREERQNARLLNKCLNGLIFTVDLFRRIYPDAYFVALVRNAYAVVEGHIRRGYDLDRFTSDYNKACLRMLEYAETRPRFFLHRFEDMIARPVEASENIYRQVDLDPGKVAAYRMVRKRHMTTGGLEEYHQQDVEATSLSWLTAAELSGNFDTSVNENQIRNLTAAQKARIGELAGEAIRRFGYEVV